ncbi:hypothetical protein vseg_018963 [Gypsophila vaccaria]
MEEEYIRKHHKQQKIGENQCSSCLTKRIKAPIDIVWSLVRRFDQPQRYKPFISECNLRGDFKVGTIREVNVRSGLPATTSTERLELLDDEQHIFGVRITGGDHRLKNYSSVITVHPETIDGRPGTLLIESFVVDVPNGNTIEDTCCFVQALINCNLNCLAELSEKMAIGNSPDEGDHVEVEESP